MDLNEVIINKFDVELSYSNNLAALGDDIYFINTTDSLNYKALWSLWSKSLSLWDAYTEIKTLDDTWGDQLVYSLHGLSWVYSGIYLGCTLNVWELLCKYSPDNTKQSTWYMIFNTLDWWDRTRSKKMKAIYVLVSWLSATKTITISASYDQATYEVLKIIDTEWDSQRIEIQTPNKKWNDLNLKVTLTWWSSSIKFHWLRVVYDITDD